MWTNPDAVQFQQYFNNLDSRAQIAVCLRVQCAVADTGPGIQADRFQDYFPQYSKPCFPALHPSAEQWSSEVTWGEN